MTFASNPAKILRWSADRALIWHSSADAPANLTCSYNLPDVQWMLQWFSSSAGTQWDPVRSPLGDPWATVGNLAEKIHRRPNGDQPFSARSSQDPSRIIVRRSTDGYKGKPIGQRSADSHVVTRKAPLDDPPINTDDRAEIHRLTFWIPHSSIKAGLLWMNSQDEQTSRWILLSQFMFRLIDF